MSKGTEEGLSWKRTIVKIIIVLVFPLFLNVNVISVYWTSILFSTDMDWFASPFTFLTAVFLMLPAIYFDRKIHSNPISSSIRRKAIISTASTYFLSFGFAFLSFFNPYFFSAVLFIPILFTPTLAISFFICLPIINRELILRSTPKNVQTYSFSFMNNAFKKRYGKRRFLPVLIWGGFLLSPIIAVGPWSDMLFLSIFYEMRVITNVFGGLEVLPIYGVLFTLASLSTLPATALIFSLRLIFVRDIYRFTDGGVTKSRLISSGLLAEIAPVAVMSLLNVVYQLSSGFPMEAFYQIILPTPIFPLLGFLYLRFSRLPIITDELWDEEEHRMWFEGDQPTLSPTQQPMEQGIKVPITYMIVSQFRKLRKH